MFFFRFCFQYGEPFLFLRVEISALCMPPLTWRQKKRHIICVSLVDRCSTMHFLFFANVRFGIPIYSHIPGNPGIIPVPRSGCIFWPYSLLRRFVIDFHADPFQIFLADRYYLSWVRRKTFQNQVAVYIT